MLHKSGQEVLTRSLLQVVNVLICYSFFEQNVVMRLPLREISGEETRLDISSISQDLCGAGDGEGNCAQPLCPWMNHPLSDLGHQTSIYDKSVFF